MRLIRNIPTGIAFYVVWTALYTPTVICRSYIEQHDAPLFRGLAPWILNSIVLGVVGLGAGSLISTSFWLLLKAISLLPIFRSHQFVQVVISSVVVACIVWCIWYVGTAEAIPTNLAAIECILAGLVVGSMATSRQVARAREEENGNAADGASAGTWPPPPIRHNSSEHL
jgi:small-conductance mechanosensitive channel